MKTLSITMFLLLLISGCNILQDTDTTTGSNSNRCGANSENDILFIAESELDDSGIPQSVLSMGCRQDHRMTVTVFAPFGYSLADHEIDNNLKEIIESKAWEHVFIEEKSNLMSNPGYAHIANSLPALSRLKSFILTSNPNTKISLIENWSNEFDFVSDSMNIQERYLDLSNATGLPVIKANQFWEQVHSDGAKPFVNSELWRGGGNSPSDLGTILISGLILTYIIETDLTSENFTDSTSNKIIYLKEEINEFNNP